MIRNVVMGKQRGNPDSETWDQDRDQLLQGLEGIRGLNPPGLLDMKVGLDAKLREGGWDFAITNDWVDANAYHQYDTDEEHNVYRKMIASACDQLARVQFTID
jgi:hypothetical protein